MMNLKDQILKTTSGRLAETAVIPTSTLANQQGIASPTTPAGVGALGGTPKQQDMAGSKAQKTNALKQSLDKVNTLQEAQADRQAQTQMTAEQEAAKQRGETLQNVLRGNAPRVQQMVGAEVAKLQSAQLSKSRSGLLASQADKQVEVDNLYDQLQAMDPDTRMSQQGLDIVLKLSDMTGKDFSGMATTVLAEAEKQKAEAAKLAADATADTVDLDMLLPQLGVDKAQMAQLLGVPETILDKLSLTELSNLLDLAVGRETVQTDAAATSGLGGAAEREAARQRSIDLSTSGVASMEADIQRLAGEIEQSQVVQFAGKQWKVGDLLSDENVSRLISDYLLNPESAESKRLAADPQAAPLIDFIKRNENALKESAQQFQKVAQEAQVIQETNKAVARVGNTTLSDEFMKKIYPDWGTAVSARYKPTGFIAAVQALPADQQEAAANAVAKFTEDHPEMDLNLAGMSPDALRALMARDSSGSTPLATLSNSLAMTKQVKNSTNVDELIGMLFGGSVSSQDEAQRLLDEDRQRQRMRGTVPSYPFLDANNDGRVDDISSLRDKMLKRIESANTVEEVVQGNKPQSPERPARSISPAETEVYKLVADNKASSVRDLEKKSLDINTLKRINEAGLGSVGLGAKIKDLEELEKLTTDEGTYEQTSWVGRINTSGADLTGLNLDDPAVAARRDRINVLRKKYGMEPLPSIQAPIVASYQSGGNGGSKKSSGGEFADSFKRSAFNPTKVLTGKNKINPFS